MRVFVAGVGVITPLGRGLEATESSLRENARGISPIRMFNPPHGNPLPVGEIPDQLLCDSLPRTHALALLAARDALAASPGPVDAVILGVTTGGMHRTEELLRAGEKDPERYLHHATGSVAECIAAETNCTGPVISVSTACSSGAVAVKLGLELLRSGAARRVLAGGADSLCKFTYYGFNSLQLIDPSGARPLDAERKGMSVAEAAALLLLEAGERPPQNALAELLGAGLSCDAYHPAAPQPEGLGARAAMEAALADAGISPREVDYINLHGTGTKDNDLSEARALRAVFGETIPALSSTKGAFGHSLGAAGAVEAAVSIISIRSGLVPANTGCTHVDPELGVTPVLAPQQAEIKTVLSNSLGFGGNNAALVIGAVRDAAPPSRPRSSVRFAVGGIACITGARNLEGTIEMLRTGRPCSGLLGLNELGANLPPREVRRMKRLQRMALSLAVTAGEKTGEGEKPASIFFGTGWGALSETNDFLVKLFESDEQYTSPTDFVGSVHNAPAGQAAILLKSTGPNITATGGDYSFEEALLCARLVSHPGDGPLLVMGADEYHESLSPLFDPSVVAGGSVPADGGGAFILRLIEGDAGLRLWPAFYARGCGEGAIHALVDELGGRERISEVFGALFVGIPAAFRSSGEAQLRELIALSGFSGAVIDYRRFTGEFASASAVAAVLAAESVRSGVCVISSGGGGAVSLKGRGVCVIGLGEHVAAIEVLP